MSERQEQFDKYIYDICEKCFITVQESFSRGIEPHIWIYYSRGTDDWGKFIVVDGIATNLKMRESDDFLPMFRSRLPSRLLFDELYKKLREQIYRLPVLPLSLERVELPEVEVIYNER